MTDREPPEPVQISPGEMRVVPTPPTPPEPRASPKSIPWKKIGEALSAVPKSIPWKKIGEGLAAARTATLNLLMLASFVAIIYFAVAELRRNVVVIDPIRLPEALRQRGYSEDVAADRLWDEVGRINERTPTAKVRVALQPASQKLDFEPPGSGIALQEVVQMLRRFLGLKETRIVGEITCMTTECKPEGLALRLRVFHSDGMKSDPMKIIPVSLNGDQTNEAEIDRNPFGDGMKIIFLDPISDQTNEAEIDRYFRAAAIELLRELDPYVVAFYLYQDDKPAAKHEALQLLIDPTHPDRKWALNLLGFIAADSWNYDRAIYWYLRALEENEEDKFAAIAYTNWGNALGAKGDPDGAIKKFTRATELDPKNAFAYNSWGVVLVKKVELAKAEAELAKAKDEWAEAIKNFTLATKLDPEYADAYSNWGNALAAKGDLDEAIKKFTLATELDPENAVAYSSLGRALRDKDKWAEAIENFTVATKLDPEYAEEILDIAFELSKLSSTADSAEALQRYANYAADAYERYLDLVPDTPIVGYIRDEINILRSDATNN